MVSATAHEKTRNCHANPSSIFVSGTMMNHIGSVNRSPESSNLGASRLVLETALISMASCTIRCCAAKQQGTKEPCGAKQQATKVH